ncbi:hypothetical protein [Flavobacterium sp.]|uniref:hypothetical protein n=1 Tax=Flavobacterium sp. TaxID=239 RepID=UPI00286B34D6|nr:hypothetical protein [Flavobacterium sp.]
MKTKTHLYILSIFLVIMSCKKTNNTNKADVEKNSINKIDSVHKTKTQNDIYINNKWNGMTEIVDVKSLKFQETSIDSIWYGFYNIRNTESYIFSVDKFLENPDVEQYRTLDTVNLKSKNIEVTVEDFSNYKTLNLLLDKKLVKQWKFKTYTNSLNSNFIKLWAGNYEGSFLRIKEEYADPRAYGTISIKIEENSTKFLLDTYKEIVTKELIFVDSDDDKIVFVDKANKNLVFEIIKKDKKYMLKSIFIDNLLEQSGLYEMERK